MYNSQKMRHEFCIGFIEFDDVEGPVISHIYPPNFPIDIESNFEIAGYALYVEGRSIFETNRYTVISHQFKIVDPKYERRYRKYALALIVGDDKLKSIIKSKEDAIEDIMANTVEKMAKKVTQGDTASIKGMLRELYGKFREILRATEEHVNERKTRVMGTMMQSAEYSGLEHIIPDNIFIVDLRLKILFCTNRKILENFIHHPEDFNILKTPNQKVLVAVRKNIFTKYPRIYSRVLKFIEEIEKKRRILSIEDLAIYLSKMS